MKFLIQVIDGKIKHDFCFHLIEAIRHQDWKGVNDIEYELTHNSYDREGIPVGSVEFVSTYLTLRHNKTPKPKNIPTELMSREWTLRSVINGNEKDVNGILFVKSNDNIKGFTSITNNAPPGNYQISEVVNVFSEWRAFVYKHKLVGLQHYSGDFKLFPDVPRIERMIEVYKSSPIAYTLDVGINKSGTFVIEVHDFFSCGLYGFSDYGILPYMFSNWFYEFIRND